MLTRRISQSGAAFWPFFISVNQRLTFSASGRAPDPRVQKNKVFKGFYYLYQNSNCAESTWFQSPSGVCALEQPFPGWEKTWVAEAGPPGPGLNLEHRLPLFPGGLGASAAGKPLLSGLPSAPPATKRCLLCAKH